MKNNKNMKNNKKDNNKKTGLLALALVLVAALIAGGTYAYWIWNSNNVVAINTIVTGGVKMGLTLNGGTATINKLAPAACTHSTYSSKVTTTISRYNETPYPGTVTLTLSLTSLKFNHGTLTSTDLGYVHYLLSTSSSSCATAVTGSDSTAISGTLAGATIGTSGTAKTQSTVLSNWVYKLPAGAAATAGTEAAPKTETYYLYVWIDPAYTFTNYNSNQIQDPLQDLEFTLQWSANTITQNVS